MKYGISFLNSNGEKCWVLLDGRFEFTKSKASFILNSLNKKGINLNNALIEVCI